MTLLVPKKQVGLAVRALLCAMLALTLVGVTGCKDSDALKKIIYDQNAETVDYNSQQKYYINDDTSEVESDQVSSLEVSDEDPESDIIQHLIVYGSDPNTIGMTAKKSAFSDNPDFTGIEASESVFFYKSDDVNAFPHAITPVPDEEEEQQEDQQDTNPVQTATSTTSGTTTSNVAGAGSGVVSAGGTGAQTTIEGESGGGPTEDQTPQQHEDGDGSEFTSTEGVGTPKEITLTLNTRDPDADIPKEDSVVAFGQYAIIAQMLGGNGALAATDAATLTQLQQYGIATNCASAIDNSASDPNSIDVKAIVASGAKIIIVEDPDTFAAGMSTEKVNYLNENKVTWGSLRNMATSANIKSNVEALGEMLQGSAVAEKGAQAYARAEQYISMHDSMIGVNGGLASAAVVTGDDGTRTDSGVLQGDGSSRYADGLGTSSNTSTYTVYVDLWDPTAVCTTPTESFSAGAAFASAGCSTTPFSYYMQAGGTINNAAAKKTSSTVGELPVLQFGEANSWASSFWSSIAVTNALLDRPGSLLDSGVNYDTHILSGEGLGTESMPKVVVKSSQIKNAIVSNSAQTNSLYHAYSFVETASYSGFIGTVGGMSASIGTLAQTGAVGDPNPTYPSGAIDTDDVLVNPSGLFCDWSQGTVESFLEAGWVAWAINGDTTGYTQADWNQYVVDFYSWAYDITLNISDVTDR